MFRVVAGVASIHGLRREPEPGRDHLGGDAFAVQAFAELLCFCADLPFGFFIDVRHGIVVVEHHRVEAEPFKLAELPIEGGRRANGRAVGVLAFADVPRPEAKPVGEIFGPG